jgi:P4 family phage/plasmid primase-like protien
LSDKTIQSSYAQRVDDGEAAEIPGRLPDLGLIDSSEVDETASRPAANPDDSTSVATGTSIAHLDGDAATPPIVDQSNATDNEAAAEGTASEFVTVGNARFLKSHVDYLQKRAIDVELAWAENVRSVDARKIREYTGATVVGTGLAFLYRLTDPVYIRVQLDDREANEGKTRCPAGVCPGPFLPSTVIEGDDSPIIIVEAPAKALAMASNGFTQTIGAAGVSAGVFEKGSRKIQPLLLKYVRPNRPVTILFDAGRASNPAVAAAEAKIARAFLDMGCTVSVAELPLGPDGQDIGPDDYLATNGAVAMQQVVANAVPAEPVAWARHLMAKGAAEARVALEHLPFLAALAAGGPAAIEGVARQLHDYATKATIKEAVGEFEKVLREKRASSSGGGNSPSGPGATSPSRGNAAPPVLERGDEVELANLHRVRLGDHIVHCEGATYRYSKGIWKVLPDHRQRAALGAFAGAKVRQGGQLVPLTLADREIRGALAHFQDLITQPSFFADAPRGLCFANGFVRLDGNRLVLEGHSPDYRARYAYGFSFEPATPFPQWQAYIDSVWEPDEDRAEKAMLLQEFVGAALFALAPRFKSALMLHGEADTGKSACLNVLRGLFPPGTVSSIGLHDFEQEYRRAALAGKLLNTVAEIPSVELLRSEAFKALIAGDQVQGRHIRQAPFDFTPIAAHIFAANTLPHVSDRSEGVWTRWLMLSFNRRFLRSKAEGVSQAKVDIVDSILKTEIPGIVAWAVAGLERLLLNNGVYTKPSSSDRALAEWRRESNPIALFFDDELTLDPTAAMPSSMLYEAYREWCTKNGFQRPFAHVSFAKVFHQLLRERARQPDVTRLLHGKTVYVGVRAKDDQPNTNADFSELLQ